MGKEERNFESVRKVNEKGEVTRDRKGVISGGMKLNAEDGVVYRSVYRSVV